MLSPFISQTMQNYTICELWTPSRLRWKDYLLFHFYQRTKLTFKLLDTSCFTIYLNMLKNNIANIY